MMIARARRGSRCCQQVLVSSELGGAGLVALQMAASMQKQGEACIVWVPGEGAAANRAAELGIVHRQYKAEGLTATSRFTALLANWLMTRKLRSAGASLIHVHSPAHYGSMRHALRWSGCKRLVHVHTVEPVDLLRWAFQSPPDAIITCARCLVDPVKQSLPEGYRESQRVVAVPNPVDVDRFQPGDRWVAKQKVGATPGRPLIVMLANLAQSKGQATTLRTVANLKAWGLDVDCWLVGEERGGATDFTRELEKLVADLQIADRVRFLGFRADVPDLLRAADFLLLPSTLEGMPLAILEAQAAKVLVLAAPAGGIPEVVADGQTGFLINAADAGSYAQRIKQCLGDPGMRDRITNGACEQVRRDHNWGAYFARIKLIYDELLN